MSEALLRIASDLEHVKQRALELESGARGLGIPAPGESLDDYAARNPHRGQAFANQLQNLRTRRAQLELDYVHGCLAEQRWSAAAVIEKMESNHTTKGSYSHD